MKAWQEYCEGKSIALVGPAPSVLNEENGDFIDSHDIVCRVNRAMPVPEGLSAHIGTRTDVLYNCLDPDPMSGGPYNFKEWAKLDWLVCPYPKVAPFSLPIGWFEHTNDLRIKNVRFVDYMIFANLMLQMGTRPNTGTMAMADIIASKAKSIFITGFTFFQKGLYIKEYRDISRSEFEDREAISGNHDQVAQAKIMTNYLINRAGLTTDRALADVINSYT